MISDVILRALDIAAISHEQGYRKNPEERIPYIVHPAAVGMMLLEAGFDDEVVAAGILHDCLEDTALTFDELRRVFGARVAELVAASSESDKSLPWEERKEAYIRHLAHAPVEVRAISACDKIHNMKSILQSLRAGCDVWAVFKRGRDAQLARFERMLPLFAESPGGALAEEYAQTLEALRST